MKTLQVLKSHLKAGEVYRRAELQQWSTSIDRHLQQLVEEGSLEKLSGGVYYAPKKSVFGKTPASEHELVKTFLKDDRFVVTSASDYNSLGVGTTQLYNERKVYNHKRHGVYKLGNRTFHFVRKPYVPATLSKEFLLVDLVNNLKNLEEDQDFVLSNVKQKLSQFDRHKLGQLVRNFGTVGTKKQLAEVLA